MPLSFPQELVLFIKMRGKNLLIRLLEVHSHFSPFSVVYIYTLFNVVEYSVLRIANIQSCEINSFDFYQYEKKIEYLYSK